MMIHDHIHHAIILDGITVVHIRVNRLSYGNNGSMGEEEELCYPLVMT